MVWQALGAFSASSYLVFIFPKFAGRCYSSNRCHIHQRGKLATKSAFHFWIRVPLFCTQHHPSGCFRVQIKRYVEFFKTGPLWNSEFFFNSAWPHSCTAAYLFMGTSVLDIFHGYYLNSSPQIPTRPITLHLWQCSVAIQIAFVNDKSWFDEVGQFRLYSWKKENILERVDRENKASHSCVIGWQELSERANVVLRKAHFFCPQLPLSFFGQNDFPLRGGGVALQIHWGNIPLKNSYIWLKKLYF